MKAPLQITTERLVLTVPEQGDAEAIFDCYASDPEVTRYVGWPTHQNVDDTRGFVRFCSGQWELGPAGPYLIRTRGDGKLIGSTGLSFAIPNEAMTGYVLAKDAWGHGYASEALAAMVELSRQLGLNRVYALCHPEHVASQRVLHKGGFVRDPNWSQQFEFPNLQPGVLQDVVCYEMKFQGSEDQNAIR